MEQDHFLKTIEGIHQALRNYLGQEFWESIKEKLLPFLERDILGKFSTFRLQCLNRTRFKSRRRFSFADFDRESLRTRFENMSDCKGNVEHIVGDSSYSEPGVLDWSIKSRFEVYCLAKSSASPPRRILLQNKYLNA